MQNTTLYSVFILHWVGLNKEIFRRPFPKKNIPVPRVNQNQLHSMIEQALNRTETCNTFANSPESPDLQEPPNSPDPLEYADLLGAPIGSPESPE